MKGARTLASLGLLSIGIAMIAIGVPWQIGLTDANAFHVSGPSLAMADSSLVIAYTKYSPESAVYVTRLDDSLGTIFRDVRASPPYGISLYPRGASVKTDSEGGIHILWTLNDARGLGTDCRLSLQYSRLSATGEHVFQNRSMDVSMSAESCGQFFVNWSLEAGEPAVHNLSLDPLPDTSSPFELSCFSHCVPSLARAADGTWFVVTAHDRRETVGNVGYVRAHVALYTYREGDTQLTKVAVIASNDPQNPMDLPETRLAPVLTVTGLVALGAGLIVLFLFGRREYPEIFRELKNRFADRPNTVLAVTGIILLGVSAFLSWFRGWPPSPNPLAVADLLTRGFLINTLRSVTGLVLVEALLVGVLLVNRSYVLIRSINLTVLVLLLPFLFFGCCFKSAPGFDVGVAVGLTGLILVHISSKRLHSETDVPRLGVPLAVRSVGAGLFGILSAWLLTLPDMFAIFTGVALLSGAVYYALETWNRERKRRQSERPTNKEKPPREP